MADMDVTGRRWPTVAALTVGAVLLVPWWAVLLSLALNPGAGPLTIVLLPLEMVGMGVALVVTWRRSRTGWAVAVAAAWATWTCNAVSFAFLFYLVSMGALM
jgi:hypothetical protein